MNYYDSDCWKVIFKFQIKILKYFSKIIIFLFILFYLPSERYLMKNEFKKKYALSLTSIKNQAYLIFALGIISKHSLLIYNLNFIEFTL